MKLPFLGLLCTIINSVFAGVGTYDLFEQQEVHFDAALTAYHNNDLDKAARIFEFLQRNIQPSSSRYQYVVCNLALLYHDKEIYSKAIQWAEVSNKFEGTNFVGGFLLAVLLFFKGPAEYYNSFMAFRSIKITKASKLVITIPEEGGTLAETMGAIIDYNMAIILYKLGAVAAADTHFDDAIVKARNLPAQVSRFRKVKASKGVDYSIDTSPVSSFRLFKSTGDFEIPVTKPLRVNRVDRSNPLSRDDAVSHDECMNEHILSYYFEIGPENHRLGPSSVPIPSPHQLSNHYDHHSDYFSHKPRVAPSNNKMTSPTIVVTPSQEQQHRGPTLHLADKPRGVSNFNPPPPARPRPVLTRGVTSPAAVPLKASLPNLWSRP
ncbi:MAG: hypothetical protein EOP45_11820 [Sphingobacteriaceae bacterium]|nr:MAG: hypothetical protein EOP45_11820 [Sphingobacteriaceae bacterium]